MQTNKSLVNRTAKAMLVAGFAALMSPLSVYAAGETVGADMQAVNQQNQVKGTVVDENGEPMIGVTVKVKGSQAATITDIDGNFTVNASNGATLELSYVGYVTQTVKATGKALSISMKPDSHIMDEVVVIGYGTVKKRDVLGAISQVKSEDIKQAPTMNAMEGLQGKISGLDITRESGQAGSSPTILLRGNRSIDGDNSPLFVIDGVSGGDISNLNPNDIESMEVLKDASSTAIYGSAGANGVIIVTTKQGSKGKISIDFNAYLGINAFPAYPESYTGSDWVDYMKTGSEAYWGMTTDEYLKNIEGLSTYTDDDVLRVIGMSSGSRQLYAQGKFINWKKELLKTGIQQNYSLSVRGGNDKMNGYVSAGYQNEGGVYRNDNFQQFTFRSGGVYNVNKILSIGFQSTLTYKNQNKRGSVLDKTLTVDPVGEIYNEDGSLNLYPAGQGGYANFLADEQEGVYSNNIHSTNINISPYIEIKPIKGLSFKSLFGASISTTRNGSWSGLNTYNKLNSELNKTYANLNHSDGWKYQWQNILSYNFNIGDAHSITLTGIQEYTNTTSETSSIYNEDFDFSSFEWNNMSAGTNPTVGSTYTNKKMMSWAARVNYSLLGRYLFSASIRWDGASQLYKDHRWDTFPAFSLGWRISDEKFMESTKSWLDNLKLRVGYGITGNSSISAYSSKTLVEDSSNQLDLGGGKVHSYILTQSVANTGLGWEKSYNTNIGIDFGFLNGRIDGSIEYYFTDTKDVLYKRPLPTAFGCYNAKTYYTMASNIARIQNQGVEITLNARPIVSKNFNWNTTVTFAKNSEKLKEINLGENTTVSDLVALNLFIDNPVTTYYSYKKVGIWQNGEEDMAACFGRVPGQVHLEGVGYVWDPTYEYEGYTRNNVTSEVTPVHRTGAYYKLDESGNKVYYRQGSLEESADGSLKGTDGKTYKEVDANTIAIGANDKQILGSKVPKFTIGWTNSFTFMNFDLSIQAVMRWGQMVEGNDFFTRISATNQPKCFDYWTPSNASNAFPLCKLGVSNEDKTALSYVDGSFIKIKNITLGYTLPKSLQQKIGMTKLRIYGTIQNPLIFAKSNMLKGLDPENVSGKYPLYKTIVFGVNASF